MFECRITDFPSTNVLVPRATGAQWAWLVRNVRTRVTAQYTDQCCMAYRVRRSMVLQRQWSHPWVDLHAGAVVAIDVWLPSTLCRCTDFVNSAGLCSDASGYKVGPVSICGRRVMQHSVSRTRAACLCPGLWLTTQVESSKKMCDVADRSAVAVRSVDRVDGVRGRCSRVPYVTRLW